MDQHEPRPDEQSAEIPHDLPQPAVGRLSLYFRELQRLLESEVDSVNSQQLGRLVDVSPAVVRRDLSALGTIGRRGVGYDIRTLIDRIGAVMGSGFQWKVVLVGVGSLGNALLRYRGFERLGFELSAAFDSDPDRVGTIAGGVAVSDAAEMEQVLTERPAELAILAVPAQQAGETGERLMKCGIQGILNFAPTTLRLPSNVAVINVDLASELQRLAFSVQSHR
ncbi:MAG: redox-sensing transcriptional repressor Rex [Rubripirellula sp.]